MRIAMVSEHASPLAAIGGVDAGGQNVHVASLAAALAARGHTITVYTRRDDAELPRRVSMQKGVEVVHIDAGPARPVPKDELLPWMDDFGDELAAEWDAAPPDVVHTHFWMSGLAALRAADNLGAARPPIVQSFHALGHVKRRHQGADDTSPAERARLEPYVGHTVDRVISTCSDEAFELHQMGVLTAKISFTPCGVDTALFDPDGPLEQRSDRFRVVALGRLVPRKGIELAIDAMALLRDRGVDDVELDIVGGSTPEAGIDADPDIQRLAAHTRRHGVTDRVRFRGQVPHAELPALLRSADAVACTPWYEPFGIVPLEAMSTGVPVIATAVGGLLDTVVHEVTGLRVPPRDAPAVADAILALRTEPAWAKTLGRNGRQRVERLYTWGRVAADTERIYRQTCAETEAKMAGTAHRVPLHLGQAVAR